MARNGNGVPALEAPPELEVVRQIHPRNGLNALTGGEWLYFTKSVVTTAYPPEFGHDQRRAHGACKPPRLMQELIEFFTKPGERVLDPFAGVGGTLIGGAIASPPRECVGIEINSKWTDIYRSVCESEGLPCYPVLEGDCREALASLPERSFRFCATDPPYNIHLERTMCTGTYDETHANRRTDYDMRSEAAGDLANLGSFAEYREAMGEVFRGVFRVLVPGSYFCVIVRNAYQNGRYIYTNVALAEAAEAVGFVLKGEKIWYQAGTRLRPYGYPFAYVPNIAHQYIVILQRPK